MITCTKGLIGEYFHESYEVGGGIINSCTNVTYKNTCTIIQDISRDSNGIVKTYGSICWSKVVVEGKIVGCSSRLYSNDCRLVIVVFAASAANTVGARIEGVYHKIPIVQPSPSPVEMEKVIYIVSVQYKTVTICGRSVLASI